MKRFRIWETSHEEINEELVVGNTLRYNKVGGCLEKEVGEGYKTTNKVWVKLLRLSKAKCLVIDTFKIFQPQ